MMSLISAPALDDELLLRHVRAAELSLVPLAVTRGRAHTLYRVNAAFARFLGRTPQQLEGLPFVSLVRDPQDARALLDGALDSGVTECEAALAFVGGDGKILLGTSLVRSVDGCDEQAAVVQVVGISPLEQSGRVDASAHKFLTQANEELILGRLREQELAEVAATATRELQHLLVRQSLLADANALLSASLDRGDTQRAVVRLAVPELSECCIVRLSAAFAEPRESVAHVDPTLEAQLAQSSHELANDVHLAALEQAARQDEAAYAQHVFSVDTREASSAVGAGRSLLRDLGACSALAVPLSARNDMFGVLFFVSFTGRKFEPRDVSFAQELGRRASTALDNALLFYEAQRASRMREDVLAIVSHDLRTPLGAVSMTAQSLLRRIDTADVQRLRRALALVLRSTGHMSRLIEELLDVANIQRGQVTLQYARVSANDMISSALEMFEKAAADKNVRISAVSPPTDTNVLCDAEKVIRVIANLMGNGIKFTPGGGSVEVSSQRHDNELRIRVSDTGPGIVAEQQSKLFEQYWKGDRNGRIGMGLGLYIARGIVDAHGGRIWVESTPPHGSAFTFALPLEREF